MTTTVKPPPQQGIAERPGETRVTAGQKRARRKDALYGLASTALSDYRQLRTRVGLQRYSENEMIEKLARAGFSAVRAPQNIGHNPWRLTFVARHALQLT